MERRIGTSKKQRELEAGQMTTFRMDDRSFNELLSYIHDYLTKLNYYNEENEVDGHWGEVVRSSVLFYLVGMLSKNPQEILDAGNSPKQTAELIQFWDEILHEWPLKLFAFGEDGLSNQISNVLADEIFVAQLKTYDPKGLLVQHRKAERNIGGASFLFSMNPRFIYTEEVDLNNLAHIYLKLIVYVQSLVRTHLQRSIYSRHDHQPDVALFLTFAELFKNTQNKMNTLPQRHLDFYYQDILHQQNQTGLPSQAIICAQLLPSVQSGFIPAGTTFSAGKLFQSKTDVLFAGQKALQVLPASIEGIQTLSLIKNPYLDFGTTNTLVSSIRFNSIPCSEIGQVASDSEGAELFGISDDVLYNPNIDEQELSSTGFIISSPSLYLAEGNRNIKFVFNLDALTAETILWSLLDQIQDSTKLEFNLIFEQIFEQAFLISYSTTKVWQDIQTYEVDYDRTKNTFTLELNLSQLDPALDLINDSFDLNWPAIKVLLNPFATIYAYSFLAGLEMKKINIDVAVSEVKELSVFNNIGKVSTLKPFDLFGPTPKQDDYLMVGKAELFKKQITQLNLALNWNNLPNGVDGFESYYAGYPSSYENDSFQVNFSVLSGGNWSSLGSPVKNQMSLFNEVEIMGSDGNEEQVLNTTTNLPLNQFSNVQIERDYQLQDPVPYQLGTQTGFLKMTFTQPTTGFGSQEYMAAYTEIAQYNALNKANIPYPNKAFVPKVGGLSLSYQAEDELVFDATYSGDGNKNFNVGEFIQLSPIGNQPLLSDRKIRGNTMITSFEAEGYLLMNFAQATVGSMLSLYVHLKSPNQIKQQGATRIIWEYKQFDQWVTLSRSNVLNDGTGGLVKSGIVELIIPANGSADPTHEEFTLRLSPEGSAQGFPNLAGVYLNALELTCTDNSPEVVGQLVPANSIKNLVETNPAIKQVFQPFDSYGGKLPETEIYARVRERLRHKSRAVTLWDFERLVLEQFQQVRIAKCTNRDEKFEAQVNQIKMIVLRSDWTFADQRYFTLDELSAIDEYLKAISSTFCSIQTMNPIIEHLLVNCLVRFDPEDVGGYYIDLLNDEICSFLSPVSDVSGQEEGIGKQVVPQMLTSYLETLPYIKSVDRLYIEHLVDEGSNRYSLGVYRGGSIIESSCDLAMLLPYDKHTIFTKANASDFKNTVGISSMELGLDFVLGEPNEGIAAPYIQPDACEKPDPNAIILIKKLVEDE